LTIVSEQLVAAVPGGHAPATRQRAALSDIGAYPIVSSPQSHQGLSAQVETSRKGRTSTEIRSVQGLIHNGSGPRFRRSEPFLN
jgi:hypothetical protein